MDKRRAQRSQKDRKEMLFLFCGTFVIAIMQDYVAIAQHNCNYVVRSQHGDNFVQKQGACGTRHSAVI